MPQQLLPDLPGFSIEQITLDTGHSSVTWNDVVGSTCCLTKGYKGSYESVRNVIISLRQRDRHASLHSGTLVSSRQATWLFLRRLEELTEQEQQMLALLRNLDTEVDLAYEMVQQFAHMLRERKGEEQLDGWLETVKSLPLTALLCRRDLSR